jgi:hypothetical protein
MCKLKSSPISLELDFQQVAWTNLIFSPYSYPVYVNIWNKESMDLHRETRVGIEPMNDKEYQLEEATHNEDNKTAPAAELK